MGVIVVSQLPTMAFTSFEWNIEVGDELVFHISSTGIIGFGWSTLQWTHLNNSIIVANITNLPELYSFYTSHSFISDVVNITKVNCRFQNGTSVSGYDRIVESLISMALLPTNSWNEIDSLFLDVHTRRGTSWYMEYTWVSRYEEDDFFFGHQGSFFEGMKGWNAHINMTTGIPVTIEDYDHMLGGYENLRLDLIEFNESGS